MSHRFSPRFLIRLVFTFAAGAILIFAVRPAQAQIASVVPARLTFPSQKTGTAGARAQAVLRNLDAHAPLVITSIEASGEFLESGDCPRRLDSGESCTLSIQFSPVVVGDVLGAITIVDDAPGSPHIISLAGAALPGAGATTPALVLSPVTLEFGAQQAGSESAPQSVTLTNRDRQPVSFRRLSASGAFQVDSGAKGDCAGSLAPGQSCQMRVSFAPRQVGWVSGAVSIDSDRGTAVLGLTGTGMGISRFAYYTYMGFPENYYFNNIGINSIDPNTAHVRDSGYLDRGEQTDIYQATVDPLGRFFYDGETYSNIHTWAINPSNGLLTSIGSFGVSFLIGNFVPDPSGQFLYVNDIYDCEGMISAFRVEPTGQLTSVQTLLVGFSSARVALHPSDKFLYLAAYDTFLGYGEDIFTIDPQTGALTIVPGSPFYNISIVFAFDPTGRFAFAYPFAGAAGINVYSVDQTTGLLTLVPGSPFPSDGGGGFTDATGRYFYQNGIGLLDVFSINHQTGALTPISGSPFPLPASEYLTAIDPSGRFAYFSNFAGNRNDTYGLDPITGALGSLFSSSTGNGDSYGGPAIVTGTAAVTYQPKFAYVANQGSNNISGYSVDVRTGVLTQVSGSPFPAGTPSSIAVDAQRKFLYATDAGLNTVSGFSIAATGALIPVPGSPFATGTGPADAATVLSNRLLFVSNSTENSVSIYKIDVSTGSLTAAPHFTVSGTTPGPLATDAGGNVLFTGNLGSNSVSAYYIAPATARLTEAADGGSPVSIGFSPGSITTDPAGPYLYITNSAGGTVSAFTISYGGVAPILAPIAGQSSFTVGTFPVSSAIDPSGRYLYVANHGSNNVSAFTIDVATGSLSSVAGSPFATGSSPSSVSVDPSAKFVLVTNAGSNNVSAFAIGRGGALTPVAGSPFPAGTAPSAAGAEGKSH